MATFGAFSLDECLGSALRAIEASARSNGLGDVAVAACAETQPIQQVHISAGHAMCAAEEAALFNRAAAA